jgi:plastocyanin
MKRRDFLKVASGAAGGAATAGAAGAASGGDAAATGATLRQENNTTAGNESGNGTAGNETAGGGGGSQTVNLVDYAFEPGTEEPLRIQPGTTVTFVWETDNHNIMVDSKPEGSDWQGHESIENSGFETEHTFEVEGTYEFYCQPHESLGMTGTIEVTTEPTGGEGGGGGEMDPHEMGVPFQAHFVGIATIVMMLVSIVFTFFTLKYGESANASSPNRE